MEPKKKRKLQSTITASENNIQEIVSQKQIGSVSGFPLKDITNGKYGLHYLLFYTSRF